MKIFGIPNRIVVALASASMCAFVEVCLNYTGALTWEYPWWNTGPAALVIVGGYFLFFSISFMVHDMQPMSRKIVTVDSIFAVNIACLVLFLGVLKWI